MSRALRSSIVPLLIFVGSCAVPPMPPKRVVLVTIDTLRADHLGCYGYPRQVTPFLDGLAADSLVFRRVLASMAHTAPSHASIFTGLHPVQHRVLRNGEALDPRLPTLAAVFRSAGYRTAAFTSVRFVTGILSGFESVESPGTRYEPVESILRRAREWIRRRANDPYFIWIHLYDVHQWSDERCLSPTVLSEVRELEPRGRTLARFLEVRHGIRPDTFVANKPQLLAVHDAYDSQLLRVDGGLGSFFSSLRAAEPARESLWIVTSDHGEGLGSHRYKGHGRFVYDEQLRVPLLVHFTDRRYRPRVVDEQVGLVDLAPTVAEWAGLSLAGPVRLAGRSLVPLVEGRPDWEETAFAQRRPADARRRKQGWEPGEMFSLVTRDLKVIHRDDGHHEVYDLERDPLELSNLFDERIPAARRLFDELLRKLEVLRAEGAAVEETPVPPEHVEELEALGYL